MPPQMELMKDSQILMVHMYQKMSEVSWDEVGVEAQHLVNVDR